MDEEVAELIAELGRPLTLRITRSGTYNPDTSTTSPVQNSDEQAFGFLLDYKVRERDGTLILAHDRKAVLKADGITKPKPTDKIIADGIEFSIIDVRTVEQSGRALIYTCQIRG